MTREAPQYEGWVNPRQEEAEQGMPELMANASWNDPALQPKEGAIEFPPGEHTDMKLMRQKAAEQN